MVQTAPCRPLRRTEPVADPGEGQLLIQVLALSLDPAMRGWMNEGRSYIPPVAIGEVMRAGGVGRVFASRLAGFAAGDTVSGMTGVQEWLTLEPTTTTRRSPSCRVG